MKGFPASIFLSFHLQNSLSKIFLLRYSIVLRGILNQPAPLDLCDITDEGLFSGLEDFVEYDPVGFPVLDIEVRTSIIYNVEG